MLETPIKKLQSKKYLFWTSLIILVLVFGIYVLNIRISNLASKIQNQKSQIQALKNREENIGKLQEDYYKIEDEVSTITAILPDEENVATFVSYLEGLSAKYNTNIKLVFNDKQNTQIEKNKYLVFDLSINGSGEAVRQYWQSLEGGPYFIKVDKFNLSTVDGLGSDSQLKLNCKVFTNEPYKITR